MDDFKYNIEVFKDYVCIKGKIDIWVLKYLIRLCKKEGFTHLIQPDNKTMMLIKREKNE